MVCRVKVTIKTEDEVVETSALLNSGFESDEPDIIIPVSVAEKLHLWPPRSTMSTLLETGGGEIITPYYTSAGELELILEDRESLKVKVNIIVNPHIDEVAVSDYVASMLGVILLDFKRGEWRLRDDPEDKVRESVKR